MTALLVVAALMSGCSTDNDSQLADAQPADQETAKEVIEPTEIAFNTISGEATQLSDIEAKAYLMVNVASKCGYTPQYADLEQLYRTYRDRGLAVVAFPANNFGGQEPGSNQEILMFCQSKFDVTFPMMAKISVMGDDQHSLYTYLTGSSAQPGAIGWNFTKFLWNAEGEVVALYPSAVKPTDSEVTTRIEQLL
jgi:glutathione peroxidase